MTLVSGTVPSNGILSSTSSTNLCVSVLDDGTIELSEQGGAFDLSWTDTNPIDVNYILIHKYNDPNGDSAEFQFCYGGMSYSKILVIQALITIKMYVFIIQI